MGTGTPTVTTSVLSAANALLKRLGKEPFVSRNGRKNYVRLVDKPFLADQLFATVDEPQKSVMLLAMRCRLCEHPSCTPKESTDVRGIMRRVAAGNLVGAKKCWQNAPVDAAQLAQFEERCICARENGQPVSIRQVISFIKD
jgi:prolycopene isomerase